MIRSTVISASLLLGALAVSAAALPAFAEVSEARKVKKKGKAAKEKAAKEKAAASRESAARVPDRPEGLTFGELSFEVPRGEEHRHTLANGVAVYVVEDHTLPLVDLSITFRAGSFLEPEGKVGLHSLTGSMVRQGGTARLSAEEFDEKVEFLAANMSTFATSTRAVANMDCITPVLSDSLDLFFEMLRDPGFEPSRLEVARGNLMEQMKQRNDDASDIHSREWRWLLYGEDYFASRSPTGGQLAAIRQKDLVDHHARYWRPENMIISISGDVTTEEILKRLEVELAKWGGAGVAAPWPPPKPDHRPRAGLYHIEKDIPQGRVFIGHLTRVWDDWDHPDVPALLVMNYILGGSGFTSRITTRIRSDEGLAYSAGSGWGWDSFWPGAFRVSYQSKSATVALAAKIALEEVRRMKDEPVSDAELRLARNSLVDTFPRRFDSAGSVAGIFSQDAFLGRDHDYWRIWRDRVRAVGVEDVQRVAREYLRPDEMVFLVVGKWEEIEPGDADQRANMALFHDGKVQHLPLRDPVSLEAQEPEAPAPAEAARLR